MRYLHKVLLFFVTCLHVYNAQFSHQMSGRQVAPLISAKHLTLSFIY